MLSIIYLLLVATAGRGLHLRLRAAGLGQEGAVPGVEEATHAALLEGLVRALALGSADGRLHDRAERATEQVTVEEAGREQALQRDGAVEPDRGLRHHGDAVGQRLGSRDQIVMRHDLVDEADAE